MSFLERSMKNKSNKTKLTQGEMEQMLDIITERGLLSKARRFSLARPLVEIPRMHIDGQKKGSATTTFSSVVLQASNLRLPWTITHEYLAASSLPKKQKFEVITKMMATQAANDLEDLAVNGDEKSTDALLRSQNGWLAQSTEVSVRTWRRENVTTQDIEKILKKQLHGVRADKVNAFVSYGDQMDMIMALPKTPVPDLLMGVQAGPVQVEPCAYIQDGHALITDPDNLVFGVVREATCWAEERASLAETKFDLDIRAAFAVQNPDRSIHLVTDPIKPKIAAWFKKVFRR